MNAAFLRPACSLVACLLSLSVGVSEAGAVVTLSPNGTVDRTTDIQNALVTAKLQGTYVLLNAGTYNHSGILTIDGAELRGMGDSSIILATDPANSAVKLIGTGAKLKTCRVKTNYSGSIVANSPDRLQSDASTLVWVKDAIAFEVNNVTVEYGRSAGIMVNNSRGSSNSSRASITNCRARNTLADGIHLTNGSKWINVQNNTNTSTCDDLIAVVSKSSNANTCEYITISGNTVSNGKWGRGISVVGGNQITISNNTITNAYHSGLYFVAEASYSSKAISNITASNNTVTGSNNVAKDGHNGVTISARLSFPLTNVTISGCTINNSKGRGIAIGDYCSNVTLTSNKIDGTTSAGVYVTGDNTSNVTIQGTSTSTYNSIIKNCAVQAISVAKCTGYIRIKNNRIEQANKSGSSGVAIINIAEHAGLTATITGNHYTNPSPTPGSYYIRCLEETYTLPIDPPNTKTMTLISSPTIFSP